MNEVLYGEILEPGEDDDRREKRVRKKFWTTLRKAARVVPYADEFVAAYFCALDPATPARVRATLLAALAYFVLPLDALPDFLAGVGFTDDVTVLLAAISMVKAHISPAHRAAAKAALDDDQ